MLVLVSALVLLAVVSAAESGVAAANRTRLKSLMARDQSRAARLHTYANERTAVLAVLGLTRTFAVIVATGIAVFLVQKEADETWGLFALTAIVLVVVFALLDSLPRVLVAKDPETWGLRLVPRFLNGDLYYLHDGRARTLEEALLLHGGEGQGARDRFAAMPAADKTALLDFVGSR